jgi:hypothetical protein
VELNRALTCMHRDHLLSNTARPRHSKDRHDPVSHLIAIVEAL